MKHEIHKMLNRRWQLRKRTPLNSRRYNEVKEYCLEKEVVPGPFHEKIKCIWRNVTIPHTLKGNILETTGHVFKVLRPIKSFFQSK